MTIPDLGRKLIYRPHEYPSAAIPLGARSVGTNSVDRRYNERRLGRPMVQVFWFVAGRGVVWVGDQEHQIDGPAILVYAPDSTHDIRAQSDLWTWRYWTMDGPQAYDLCCGFGLSEGLYPAQSVPHDLFEDLAEAILDVSARGERYASALAFRLLTVAAFPPQASMPPVVAQCIAYIDQHWQDSGLTIQHIADEIDLHRSQLTRQFTEVQGISPIQYLTGRRIQAAQGLLKRSDLSIQAVAQESGFEDPSYFSRVFRQRCGMTPLQFRLSGIPR